MKMIPLICLEIIEIQPMRFVCLLSSTINLCAETMEPLDEAEVNKEWQDMTWVHSSVH